MLVLALATSAHATKLTGVQSINHPVTKADKERAVTADKDARFLSHSRLCEGPAAAFVSKCRKAYIYRELKN